MSYKQGYIPSKDNIPYEVAQLTRDVEELQNQVQELQRLVTRILKRTDEVTPPYYFNRPLGV